MLIYEYYVINDFQFSIRTTECRGHIIVEYGNNFHLPWRGRSRLAWCPYPPLYVRTWRDFPHPRPSPTACLSLPPTHSPGGIHGQLQSQYRWKDILSIRCLPISSEVSASLTWVILCMLWSAANKSTFTLYKGKGWYFVPRACPQLRQGSLRLAACGWRSIRVAVGGFGFFQPLHLHVSLAWDQQRKNSIEYTPVVALP